MLCIRHRSTNPYFNIASEEYLLKSFTDDIFMLYINEPSVIVGKHQNTLAEIDYQLVKDRGIEVVRRLSGGGAVFHDLGNLNFTFIRNGKEGKLVDFRGFTKPIIDILREVDVNAQFEGHNSLNIDGKKFSGNAEHIFKNRVMHHGTMLFSTDMQTLADVLYVNSDRFSDSAVKSVRSKTTNLSEHLPKGYTIDDFAGHVMDFVLRTFKAATTFQFTQPDLDAIKNLVTSKYSRWDWNFGYSPSYRFTRTFNMNNEPITIDVAVERGVIKDIQFPYKNEDEYFQQVSYTLKGIMHHESLVYEALKSISPSEEDPSSLMKALF